MSDYSSETMRITFSAAGVITCSGAQVNRAIAVTGDVTSQNRFISGNGNGILAGDGNVYGSVWGNDYLINYLGRYALTSNIPNIVGSLGVGQIGTYALMYVSGQTQGPGWTVPGSSIYYAACAGSALYGGVASGSWRLMGYINAGSAAYGTSVYLRYA